jgi:hypothetical protein
VQVETGLADGTLVCSVLQGSTVLATSSITHTEINDAMPDLYNHGFLRFDFDSLQLNVAEGNSEEDYIIQLEFQGWTNDTDNFVAWNRHWDIKLYPTYGDVVDNQAPNDFVEPLGFELFEYRSI